jgi:hypothetical protein
MYLIEEKKGQPAQGCPFPCPISVKKLEAALHFEKGAEKANIDFLAENPI